MRTYGLTNIMNSYTTPKMQQLSQPSTHTESTQRPRNVAVPSDKASPTFLAQQVRQNMMDSSPAAQQLKGYMAAMSTAQVLPVQLGKDKNASQKVGGSKKQRQRNVGQLGVNEAFTDWFHNAKQKGQVSKLLGVDISGGRDSVDSKQAKVLYAHWLKITGKEEDVGGQDWREETATDEEDDSSGDEEESAKEEIARLHLELERFDGDREGKKWEKFQATRLERLNVLEGGEEEDNEEEVDEVEEVAGIAGIPVSANPFAVLADERT